MGWQVIIAPSAMADLEEIVSYIAKRNSDAAAKLGFELIAHAESLRDFPEMGRMVPEFRQPNLREIIWGSYRIIYRSAHKNNQVQIVRFWHGARGVPNLPSSH